MWLFWWKKYEGDGLATFLSMLGTILVTLGSIGLIAALNDSTGVFSFIIGIVAFVILKLLLNTLTDVVDKKFNEVTYHASKQMQDRKVSKQRAILDEGTDQKAIYKMIKKANPVDLDLQIDGIRKLTDQSLIYDLIQYEERMNRDFTTGQIQRSEYFIRLMTELTNQITDEDMRNRKKEQYGIRT